ncbi:tetratricopeptide repeat protein [candidate division KSB1 bacterium]|nr:tetratricopeptide repeat protein [candidate division KSB1 bacterium]
MENINYLLAFANITITIIGVSFAAAALVTFFYLKRKLKEVTKSNENFKSSVKDDLYLIQEAMHKILAGYNCMDKKEIDNAIELFQRAVEIYPTAFNAYNSLGYAYIEKGDFSSAIHCFQLAIQHFPMKFEGHYDLATAYEKSGQKELAEKHQKIAKKMEAEFIS